MIALALVEVRERFPGAIEALDAELGGGVLGSRKRGYAWDGRVLWASVPTGLGRSWVGAWRRGEWRATPSPI